MSVFSFPPTHSTLHAVTLGDARSSEKKKKHAEKKQVKLEQVVKQYIVADTCYTCED